MPAKMYSKHDTKNRVVFSEFLILDFSCFTMGGMNLHSASVHAAGWKETERLDIPRLFPNLDEGNCLYEYTQAHLAKKWCQNFSRNQVRSWPFPTELRKRARPAHCSYVSR